MAAPKGNQFWKARAKHGRDKLLSDPLALWEDCQGYFEWIEANPLSEAKAFAYQGEVTMANLPKMRAMTLAGLSIHLGIDQQTWRNYRDNKDFIEVITRVETIIEAQKFEGAAAELLNPNIIARDLGLADKRELTGNDGGPVEVDHKIDAVEQLGVFLERLAKPS